MKLIDSEAFLAWAKTLGIEQDARYAEPRTLVYPENPLWYRWELDELARNPSIAELDHLFDRLLMAVDPWHYCRIWKRIPLWDYSDVHLWRLLIHEGLVPVGHTGALEFASDERHQVKRVLLAQMSFGWTTYDDIYVVPDHGKVILTIDHGQEIVVAYRDEKDLRAFCGRANVPVDL